jgi:hypothetical protein
MTDVGEHDDVGKTKKLILNTPIANIRYSVNHIYDVIIRIQFKIQIH